MKHLDPTTLLSEANRRAASTRQRLAYHSLSMGVSRECMSRSKEALAVSRELLQQPLYDVFTGRLINKR